VDGTPGGIACRWQVEPGRDDQAGRQDGGEAGAQPGGSASVRLVSAPTGWRTVTSARPQTTISRDLAGIAWVIAGGESLPAPARWKRSECGRFGIAAWPRVCHSSSSSGTGCGRSKPGARSTAARGSRSRPHWRKSDSRGKMLSVAHRNQHRGKRREKRCAGSGQRDDRGSDD
jgi:hypothetical protein